MLNAVRTVTSNVPRSRLLHHSRSVTTQATRKPVYPDPNMSLLRLVSKPNYETHSANGVDTRVHVAVAGVDASDNISALRGALLGDVAAHVLASNKGDAGGRERACALE
jgi:hypothetical protein